MVFLMLAILSGCQPDTGFYVREATQEPEQAALQNSAALTIEKEGAGSGPAQKSVLPPPIEDEHPAIQSITPAPTEEAPGQITPLEITSQFSPTAPVEAVETAAPALPVEAWKDWPVMPAISEEMRQVYLRGLAEGRSPNAFSILGDCQSQPEVFLGVFDSDPDVSIALPASLRQTVEQFRGSFDRYSPTVKDGTTEGALLWVEWNDNKEKKCQPGETPLDCELRVHQPSIVFVHIGTHYESRQMGYMRKIIERILQHGAVPVIVTKADNRELDEKINPNLVAMAVEYHLPVWNFWKTVQHLPNRGMEKDSRMYLSKEGLVVHRMSALEALDAVWRGLQ